MKELKNYIQSAENKWLKQLYNYCEIIFTEKKVPSHDHTHHLRVWEYTKEILNSINNSFEINYNLVESCLIASLFHDTGLIKTLDKNHGYESRNICENYFKNNNIEIPENFDEILYAIEKHDDKNYKLYNNNPDSVLSIHCNADDLDAFGKIGVIRYTEIYLLRGINLDELPNLVIKNLDKRFLNFEKTYKDFTELYEKHKPRYLTTRKFFEDLLQETI
ncbi:MAG: HD domain-containing protein [Bacteroidales bacterium]|nr:HD domain-containing protein [Bacteroidales bacterium]